MCRVLRAEAEARLGERRVPIRLQHLHHRLLDEAVEHRRNAERPHAARCLRYLNPPHRLWLVGALKQLSPDREPVLLQVSRQVVDAHTIDASRTLVALQPRQRFLQILTLDDCFHRRSRDRRAFATVSPRAPGVRDRLPPLALRTLGRRCSGLHPSLRCPSSARPDSSAAWLARVKPLYWPLPPFGPSAARRRLLCPRLTSAPRSDRLTATSVSLPRRDADLPR